MRILSILAGGAVFLAASSAGATTLIHPSEATHTREHGVTLWRGAKATPPAAPSLKGAGKPCAEVKVVLYGAPWPARHLRTHRILDDADRGSWADQIAYRPSTQGFWEERMRAGY